MNLKTWVLATRPKTLSAAIVPVLMATALVAVRPGGGIVWWAFGCALAGSVLIQIATNFINDALDFRKGADTRERLGPMRVTQAGLVSADTVMRAAAVALALAALCGVPLIYRGGWPMLVIGLASIAAAYAYTGGPYPLAYHGLGEVFVVAFFGVVAVGGTYYVLTLDAPPVVFVAGIGAGTVATVLLVINNLRDIDTDRASRKKTLAVRMGPAFARFEVALFAILPLVAAAVAAWMLGNRWLLLPWAASPLALVLIRRCYRSAGAELNRALALAGAYQWAYGVLFVIGVLMR